MRCKACNKIMTEQEMTKKDNRGEYLDLCSDCYSPALEATFDAFDDPLFGNITQTKEDAFTD